MTTHVQNGKAPKPPLFELELFPSLEVKTGTCCLAIGFFTVEMLRNEFVSLLIPRLVQYSKADNETEALGYKLLMTYTDIPPLYAMIL
jgi:hypothetical protein